MQRSSRVRLPLSSSTRAAPRAATRDSRDNSSRGHLSYPVIEHVCDIQIANTVHGETIGVNESADGRAPVSDSPKGGEGATRNS